MDVGELPQKRDKVLAIPKNLYLIEFTSFAQFHREFFILENSNEIRKSIFELNGCETTVIHYGAEFSLVGNPKAKIIETDGYLVTFLMYNEVGYYFAHTSNIKLAWEEAKTNIHNSIEKITLTRYSLINSWRDCFVQPFKIELNHLHNSYLNLK